MAAAHQFFFLEADDVMFEQLDRFQRDPQNAEEIAFREGGFYVRARGARAPPAPPAPPAPRAPPAPPAPPERVTGIAAEGRYARPASPAGSVLGVAIRVRGAPGEGGAPPERERRGFMTAAQYERLCIFVIAESRSADLLGEIFPA
jgi:hypothetical protein